MKLLLAVVVDVILGLTISAVLLGVAIPLLIRNGVFQPGDGAGTGVVAVAIALAILAMLVRPGSALHRHHRK